MNEKNVILRNSSKDFLTKIHTRNIEILPENDVQDRSERQKKMNN